MQRIGRETRQDISGHSSAMFNIKMVSTWIKKEEVKETGRIKREKMRAQQYKGEYARAHKNKTAEQDEVSNIVGGGEAGSG